MSRVGWGGRFVRSVTSRQLYFQENVSRVRGGVRIVGQTAVVVRGWFPAGETHVEIGFLVEEVDLVLGAIAVEGLQCKSRSHFWVKCGA